MIEKMKTSASRTAATTTTAITDSVADLSKDGLAAAVAGSFRYYVGRAEKGWNSLSGATMTLLEVLKEVEPAARSDGSKRWNFDEPGIKELAGAITEVYGKGELTFFGQKQIHRGGSPMLARMCMQVLAERGPSATVAWLEKLHNAKNPSVRTVIEVVGLECKKTIQFSTGVRLSLLDELPQSPNVKALGRSYESNFETMSVPSHGPTVAVHEDAIFGASREPAPEIRSQKLIEQALLGLCVSGEVFPNTGSRWQEFVDSDFEAAVFGRMWGGEQAGHPPTAQVSDKAVAYAEKFISLNGDLARRCHIAAHRIRSARSRWDHSQRVIDIAVALEALLLPPESASEIAHRLKIRAAMLVASSHEERSEIAKLIKDFYSVRSKVVHGVVVAPVQKHFETIERVQKIAEQILRIEIDLGRTPNFDAIDLGGPA
jgi:hypothetical protein